MTASATPTIRDAYVTNADTCFILFSFFSPIAMDAAALPPIPNMLANAINSIKIGFVRLTAATCSGSPVCQTKKVSAMLYTTVTRLLITLGIAIFATAFGTGRLLISSFSFIFSPFFRWFFMKKRFHTNYHFYTDIILNI